MDVVKNLYQLRDLDLVVVRRERERGPGQEVDIVRKVRVVELGLVRVLGRGVQVGRVPGILVPVGDMNSALALKVPILKQLELEVSGIQEEDKVTF
jgi:hypothetical protein